MKVDNSRGYRRRLHLLMWVYRGGRLWDQTLDDLALNARFFDSVTLSINGPDRIALAEQVSTKVSPDFLPVILKTPHSLDAVEHVVWSSHQEELLSIPEEDLLVITAEDDFLNFSNLLNAVYYDEACRHPILFGSWDDEVSPKVSLESAEIRVVRDQADIKHELIGRGKPGASPVCISGLTMSAAVFRSAANTMSGRHSTRLLLAGVRTEYFFATQPLVDGLVVSRSPIARVSEHEDRESHSISSTTWNHDESLFQLWLLASGYPMGLELATLTTLRFLRSVCRAPSVLRYLMPAFKHFRRAARA